MNIIMLLEYLAYFQVEVQPFSRYPTWNSSSFLSFSFLIRHSLIDETVNN